MSLYWASGTARPEAAGSSSKRTQYQGRAAAPCTWSQSASDWARVLSHPYSRLPARSPTDYPAELAHLVGTLEQTLALGRIRGRARLHAGQRMPGVIPGGIEGAGHQTKK